VFPELNPDSHASARHERYVVISTRTDDESRDFLAHMGMPFPSEEKTRKEEVKTKKQ